MTNADKIRMMAKTILGITETDKLADEIMKFEDFTTAYCHGVMSNECEQHISCVACLVEWLGEECEEDA